MYVRTDVHDVMALKPNFLTSMGYHIFLSMVLRARAPSARAELRYYQRSEQRDTFVVGDVGPGCWDKIWMLRTAFSRGHVFFFPRVRRTKKKRPFLYQSQGQLKLKHFLEENTVSLKFRSHSSIALQNFFFFISMQSKR